MKQQMKSKYKRRGVYGNKGMSNRMESLLTIVPYNLEREGEKELKIKLTRTKKLNLCLRNILSVLIIKKLKSEQKIKSDTTSYMRLGHGKFCFHSTLTHNGKFLQTRHPTTN